MRAIFLVLLFSLLSNICNAQKSASINDVRNVFDKKGDYYFNQKEYKKSIVYYNMAYKKDANNYYSVLKKAEAFTALGLLDQAIESYKIIFETDLFITNDYRLKYAKLLLKNKDIKGFEKWMGIYNGIVYDEISGYVSSSEARAKMYKDSSFVLVENESILNTPESEICPAVYKDKLVFASTRKNLTGTKENSYYNSYSANFLSSGQLGRLNKFNKSLNSSENESSLRFFIPSNKMYFTRSSVKSSTLKTYVSNIPSDISTRLNISELTIAGFTGSIGHATFNNSGTIMYFVSDAAGGSGGLDIYSSNLVAGKWSTPKNLGSTINSNKDEMYPYVLNDTVLYFSSAGHNSLGGIDLYSVSLSRENSSPKNLGSKVNSKYDDYGLSFSPGGITGYFCSNRPGGFGKEDIYRLQLLDLKVKYAAYKHRLRTNMEEGKINLYLNNGDEYNIASEGNTGFNFSFQPEENYKMVIQHENATANNIVNNTSLGAAQKRKEFLYPSPIQKTDIKLQAGMKYQFTAGMKPLSNEYRSAIKNMASDYQNTTSTIDLTALAKELHLKEGEIYTIRFVKDDSQYSGYKAKGESSLFINNEIIPTVGRSFFFVLPLDIEVNFNIKTDIAHFKETYNPKKVGAVKIDEKPVLKEIAIKEVSTGFPILVNAETYGDLGSTKKISATELTIVPGSLYILTLTKTDAGTGKKQEVIVPLTKGVKYNLGTEGQTKNEYNKALSKMSTGKASGSPDDEELIDISVLSKELDIISGSNIVFSLMPAAKIASQTSAANNVMSTLDIDGRKIFVTNRQRFQVNLKLDQAKKVNIQTDLAYVKENFDASTIAMNLDTSSFNKDIITDPIYDVVVVNFDLNDYAILPNAKSIIDNKVINELKGDSRLYVTIKGYTDGLGDAAHNKKLSSDRAHSVKSYLASNGIGENRIRTFSFGESLSLKGGVKWEDLSEAELKKHRKVEIVIYLPEK